MVFPKSFLNAERMSKRTVGGRSKPSQQDACLRVGEPGSREVSRSHRAQVESCLQMLGIRLQKEIR